MVRFIFPICTDNDIIVEVPIKNRRFQVTGPTAIISIGDLDLTSEEHEKFLDDLDTLCTNILVCNGVDIPSHVLQGNGGHVIKQTSIEIPKYLFSFSDKISSNRLFNN